MSTFLQQPVISVPDFCLAYIQVVFNEVGDRQMDHIVHIYRSGQIVPIMHYNAVAELAEITYANYNDGAWEGLIWTGGIREVQWLNSRLSSKCWVIVWLNSQNFQLSKIYPIEKLIKEVLSNHAISCCFLHCWHILVVVTHWSRVPHISVNELTIIVSDSGLSPGRCQAIIWNSAALLLTGQLETNFS